MARTNYIFVDFENVQETDLDRISQKPVKVIYILGERQKSLPVTLVKKFLQFGSQVQIVEVGRTGKNAADFVMAQHIGEVKMSDPDGYIHILSNDKGFDALVGHNKTNGTPAARHTSFSEIPVLMNVEERVTLIARQLAQKNTTRPKTRKALESQIGVVFGKTLSGVEVDDIITRLVAGKIFTISESGELCYLKDPQLKADRKLTPHPKLASIQVVTKTHSQTGSAGNGGVLSELADQCLNHLRLHPDNRPKLKTSLANYLFCQLGNKHPSNLVYGAIKNLRQAGHLSFIKDSVTYHL